MKLIKLRVLSPDQASTLTDTRCIGSFISLGIPPPMSLPPYLNLLIQPQICFYTHQAKCPPEADLKGCFVKTSYWDCFCPFGSSKIETLDHLLLVSQQWTAPGPFELILFCINTNTPWNPISQSYCWLIQIAFEGILGNGTWGDGLR